MKSIVKLSNEYIQVADGYMYVGEHGYVKKYYTKKDYEQLEDKKCVYISKEYTHIEKGCFKNTEVVTVEMENGIREIEEEAFKDCYNLRGVKLSECIDVIGQSAFSHCINLRHIYLPESLRKVGKYAFENCKNLRTLDLKNGVCEFGSHYYLDNCKLICRNPKMIMGHVNCKAITCHRDAKFNIPKYVQVDYFGILHKFFASLSGKTLEEIVVVSSNVTIKKLLEKNSVQNINEIINKHNSRCATELLTKNHVFLDYESYKKFCGEEKHIIVSEGVTKINPFCFAASDIESVVLPESLQVIGAYAFYDCKNLRYVYMSSNIRLIEECAFEGCDKLKMLEISEIK